jgi:hypothetical protein
MATANILPLDHFSSDRRLGDHSNDLSTAFEVEQTLA